MTISLSTSASPHLDEQEAQSRDHREDDPDPDPPPGRRGLYRDPHLHGFVRPFPVGHDAHGVVPNQRLGPGGHLDLHLLHFSRCEGLDLLRREGRLPVLRLERREGDVPVHGGAGVLHEEGEGGGFAGKGRPRQDTVGRPGVPPVGPREIDRELRFGLDLAGADPDEDRVLPGGGVPGGRDFHGHGLALAFLDPDAGDLLLLVGRLEVDLPLLRSGRGQVEGALRFSLVGHLEGKFEAGIALAPEDRIGGDDLDVVLAQGPPLSVAFPPFAAETIRTSMFSSLRPLFSRVRSIWTFSPRATATPEYSVYRAMPRSGRVSFLSAFCARTSPGITPSRTRKTNATDSDFFAKFAQPMNTSLYSQLIVATT